MKGRGFQFAPNAVGLAMLAAVCAAWWLTPRPSSAAIPQLSHLVPTTFGDWRQIETTAALVDPAIDRKTTRDITNPYDDVLMRAYGDSRGDVVLLALAYGRDQRQEVKIHRPELCYVAQGFNVLYRMPVTFSGLGDGRAFPGARMLVAAPGRVEAVSYWIRIGNIYSESVWTTRAYIFTQGLKGRMPDGILVRVSQIIDGPAGASESLYRIQERFITDLVRAMPEDTRRILVVRSAI